MAIFHAQDGQHNTPEPRSSVVALSDGPSAERDDAGEDAAGRKSDYVRSALRPHSTPATLLWLEANYEMADGVCIPRSTLYAHYVHFCGENGLQPVNAASFGKIIRQQFPLLTTRRLGTRGQSRYHYYGIAIRESSQYYEVSYSKKGVGCNSDNRRDVTRQSGLCQSRCKLSPLLPEFPNLRDISLPAGISEERVTSFLMMYRTHCHRIYDTIMRASLEEVQNFLLHFWQGMPPHLLGILGTNVVVNMVGVCDSILYRTICNVLMPSVLQSVPDNLLHIIRKFALELEVWLHMALEDLPTALRNVKLSLAHNFSQMLKRQTSLNHLCQAAQMVIHNGDLTNQMLQDFRRVDLQSICRQTMYAMDKNGASLVAELIANIYHEFEQLLEGQATIETYAEWLESIVERCVIQPANRSGNGSCLRQIARQFLLVWSIFGTRVIRDMTLHSAPSFGSFHLLHLMFDDYVLHLVDILHSEDRAKEMLRNVNCDYPHELDTNWESTDTDDTALGDPSRDCPTLDSDYSQLENIADDAQDIPEVNHQPVGVEYLNHPEPFPTSYQYDTDCRNGYKITGRSCMYQVYNQNLTEDDTVSSTAPDERSIKYPNSSVPYYSGSDCNYGICPQYASSRRGDHDELTTAGAGAYYQDHSGAMHSISASSYHSYDPNANCHFNRARLKDGMSGMKNHLHSSKTCIEELEHNYFRPM